MCGGNVGGADKRGPLRGERAGFLRSKKTERVWRAVKVCADFTPLVSLSLDSSLGEGALRDVEGAVPYEVHQLPCLPLSGEVDAAGDSEG